MIADGRNCQRWSSDFLGIETMVGRMAQGLRSSRADQQAERLEKSCSMTRFFQTRSLPLLATLITLLLIAPPSWVDAFVRGRWEPGFKFLPVPYESKFEDYYLPAALDAADYPNLIKQDERIPTIAVPTVLVAFNWLVNSNRFECVEAQKYSKSGLPLREEEVLCHPMKGDTQLPAEC
jgi:hypothetical protein